MWAATSRMVWPSPCMIKVSSRTFIALRPNSTQRTAGYAEAEKKERYEQVERQVPKGVAARWQETATTEPQELVEPGVLGRRRIGQDEDLSMLIYQIPRVTASLKASRLSRVCWLGPLQAATVLQQQQIKTVKEEGKKGTTQRSKVNG
eukprot:6056717-Pleurochrysis_carterae.AAC.1